MTKEKFDLIVSDFKESLKAEADNTNHNSKSEVCKNKNMSRITIINFYKKYNIYELDIIHILKNWISKIEIDDSPHKIIYFESKLHIDYLIYKLSNIDVNLFSTFSDPNSFEIELLCNSIVDFLDKINFIWKSTISNMEGLINDSGNITMEDIKRASVFKFNTDLYSCLKKEDPHKFWIQYLYFWRCKRTHWSRLNLLTKEDLFEVVYSMSQGKPSQVESCYKNWILFGILFSIISVDKLIKVFNKQFKKANDDRFKKKTNQKKL